LASAEVSSNTPSRKQDSTLSHAVKVLCLPDWRDSNPYQSLLQRSLAELGLTVEYGDVPAGSFPLLRSWWRAGQPTVLHLHWSNELIGPSIWPRSSLVRSTRRALMALDVRLLKLMGCRVVWTIHNLVAHESVNRDHELRARRALLGAVDRVIVHSAGALARIRQAYAGPLLPDHRVSVIPHGNYDGCYAANPSLQKELAARWGLDHSTTTILFFGAIRPYKGLERLLTAFRQCSRQDLRLVVAGRPSDTAIREVVECAARVDSRVVALLDFIADEQVSALFALADVVAIPFERALTSGSAVLAMTFGKALILPDLARDLEFAAEGGCVYFQSDDELPALLTSLTRTSLEQMGQANRHFASERNWTLVAAQTRLAYGPLRDAWGRATDGAAS
jgi:glycosyltransferase involved in cell wall biosynthesis